MESEPIADCLKPKTECSCDFPLTLEPGANYNIGFTYVSGLPPATGFDIEWIAILGNGLSSNARPPTLITRQRF